MKVLYLFLFWTNLAYGNSLDDLRRNNWGLNNNVNNYASIRLKESAQYLKKKKRIIIAVIDTGVDCSHPALKNCLQGWNFLNNTPAGNVDVHGHGTHVAGIIQQINPDTTILPLIYYSDNTSGQQNVEASIKAIKYAVKEKVDIINYSGGGPERNESEYLALREAQNAGIVIVASAGNNHARIEDEPYFPASYNINNIISVGNVDIKGKTVNSSNYGDHIDIVAPGDNIISAAPNKKYTYMTGTSQSAAFISGIVSLALSSFPNLSVDDLKKYMKDTSIVELQSHDVVTKKADTLSLMKKLTEKFDTK